MKKIILVLLFTLLTTSSLIAQEWISDFAEAQRIAQNDNKKILLLFAGSDWCAPCIKLERFVLDTEEFAKFAATNYVLMKADFPRKKKNQLSSELQKQNAVLADTYNKQGSFPLLMMINIQGEKIGEIGYKKVQPTAYIDILKSWETR